MPDRKIPSRLEGGELDKKTRTKIERSIKGKEAAPTVAEQTGTFVDWNKVRDQLGQPFDVEQIPLRKRREMRRDPMIAFGGHYITTPIARVPFHMDAKDKKGPNAQVSAFIDAAFRQIFARYIFTRQQSLYFGYQAQAKRFQEKNPGGTYLDPRSDNPDVPKPVWDEGNIQPIIWKTFVGLDPGRVEPIFNNKGEFDGIRFDVPPTEFNKNLGFRSIGLKNSKSKREIDIYHALWSVNDRDSVWGSLYGYPRTAHAYRYWWSYWFRWAMSDRAFERHAVPPMLARHPEGSYRDPDTNEEFQNWEIAIETARMLRSNSIAAVPSTMATAGLDEKGTASPEWDFHFLEPTGESFKFMDESFNYLDVMKLRSMWVPEQAFIEGEGGTSSRNVAAQMAEIFIQSQQNLWEEIADEINRFIIPQLLIVNFPEFVNNGGTCRIVGHGFQSEDIDLLKQLVQLVGQQDASQLNVDMPEALSRLGIPTLDPATRIKEQQQIENAATAPPPVVPSPGSVGVIPNPGSTNGGSIPGVNPPQGGASVMGFDDSMIYVQPREQIVLSDETEFVTSLPNTHHFDDKALKALSVQMRRIWMSHFRALYPEFAQFIDKQTGDLILSDDIEEDLFASDSIPKKAAIKAANRLLDAWTIDSKRLTDLANSSASVMTKMMKRYSKLAQKAAGVSVDVPVENFQEWIDGQVGRLITSTHATFANEMRDFLVGQLRAGGNAKSISKAIHEHFSDFPKWKADRVARSETRDVVNASTLLTAQAADFKFVKASDGTTFDERCRERDGKLFTVKEAFKEMSPARTHPNDTLGFTMIPRADFNIEFRNGNGMPDGAPQDALAFFDQEIGTVFFADGLVTDSDVYTYAGAVADKIIKEAARV
jgi:hypothetical protein